MMVDFGRILEQLFAFWIASAFGGAIGFGLHRLHRNMVRLTAMFPAIDEVSVRLARPKIFPCFVPQKRGAELELQYSKSNLPIP